MSTKCAQSLFSRICVSECVCVCICSQDTCIFVRIHVRELHGRIDAYLYVCEQEAPREGGGGVPYWHTVRFIAS